MPRLSKAELGAPSRLVIRLARRQHAVAVFAAFALLDLDDHALAVDWAIA